MKTNFNLKKVTALISFILMMIVAQVSWGQTTVFSDDFSTNQSATWTTSGAIGASA